MNLTDKALHFAVDAHSGRIRKGNAEIYVFHPLEAACIAATLTRDENVLAAAALHDVVEDTSVTLSDIREAFGERVACIVGAETEDKKRDRPASETWEERKNKTVEDLKKCSDDGVRIVALADKLSNMRSFYRLKISEGDAMWSHFSQKDPMRHFNYYRSIADILKEDFGETASWKEFDMLISLVFEGK